MGRGAPGLHVHVVLGQGVGGRLDKDKVEATRDRVLYANKLSGGHRALLLGLRLAHCAVCVRTTSWCDYVRC